MDIKRAKIILIIFFLAINVVLLGVIVFSGNENRVSKTILENVEELFIKNNKVILCDIPDNLKPVPQLEMGEDIRIGRVLGNDLQSAEFGFDTKNYVFFHDFDQHSTYVEIYKGNKIFENRINVYGESIEYVNREIFGFNQVKINILPAYAILLKEYLNSDIKAVEKIKFIYIKYPDEDIVGPVWLITADGKDRYFYAFEAFNGLEIQR